MFYLTVWGENVKKKCPSRLLSGVWTAVAQVSFATSEKRTATAAPW
jgi:hypothetical protein